MAWRLPLADVQLSEPVIEAAMEALRSNWLTMGPRTQSLEMDFAAALERPHAVAVSSGTAGIHLACLAAGVGEGDEVIVPAVGFVADAHAAHWCGGRTVFADVTSEARPLLDPDAVEALITDRTKAVLAIHMFGYPLELAGLRALCDERGIALIEDCCESVGATFADGSPVGTAGQSGCFSFFAKTQLPVGEGGSLAERGARAIRGRATVSRRPPSRSRPLPATIRQWPSPSRSRIAPEPASRKSTRSRSGSVGNAPAARSGSTIRLASAGRWAAR